MTILAALLLSATYALAQTKAMTTQQVSTASTMTVTSPLSASSLRVGSTGSTVTALQEKLKTLGLYTGAVSGTYDKATMDAVVSFQTSNRLTADGIAGTRTLGAIGVSGSVTAGPIVQPAGVSGSVKPLPVATPAPIVKPTTPSVSPVNPKPNGQACANQKSMIIAYEDTSSDGPIFAGEDKEELGRFWIYPTCNISIDGINLDNKARNTQNTQWIDDTTQVHKIYVHTGFANSPSQLPVLGTIINSVGGKRVTFSQPLQLFANQPQRITISGDIDTNASGTAQVCFVSPNGIKDSGTGSYLMQPNYTDTNKFLGYFTCADRQEVEE